MKMSMHRVATLVATVGGLGRLPAPGTWGSLAGCWLGLLALDRVTTLWRGLIVVGLFLVGALVCTRAERHLGRHDPSEIILDEVWAMMAIIAGLAQFVRMPQLAFWSLLTFRFFDIVKPPPLRWLARLPAGWGIMADDAGAAAYTLLLCWFVR